MISKEVCNKYNVTADTLRYYEKIGLLDRVTRKENGIRDYQQSDLVRLEFILCMRATGLSIAALQEYIALYHEGNETILTRKEILITQKKIVDNKMAELQKLHDKITNKIATYDETIAKIQAEENNIS